MTTAKTTKTAKISDSVEFLILRRERQQSDPCQISMLKTLYLDHDVWIKGALETATVMRGPFFFSDLRKKLVNPHHPNDWGQLAKALLKYGWRRTGQYRQSQLDSRRGGLDWEYERRGGF